MRFRRNEPVVAVALFATPLLAGLLAAPAGAPASPLAPQACTALKTERQDLIASGAKSDMEKGPVWAKANLSSERLGKIERLIAVEEQLSFRCDDPVTARPQLKKPPAKTANADGGDKEPATAKTAADADSSAAPQKPAKKRTAGKTKRKAAGDAAD